MSNPNPNHDNQASLRDALRRDAARLKQPLFDTALHHTTMRRIRALSSTDSPRLVWRWSLACAAALVLGVTLTLSYKEPSPRPTTIQTDLSRGATIPSAPTSAWAYQWAAAQSDEALLAMLDHDARRILPPTASIFTTPLN